MKTKFPPSLFQVKGILLLIVILLNCCGPSREENQKILEQQKQMALSVFQNHKQEAEEYKNKLHQLRDILVTPDSEIVSTNKMSPVLKAGHDHENPNAMIIAYSSLADPDLSQSDDVFDLYFQGNANAALDYYKQIKDGRFFNDFMAEEPRSWVTKEYFENIVSSLSTKVTPYVLVVQRVTRSRIEVKGSDGFTGGTATGNVWLVDLRSMQVLGSMPLIASPTGIVVKENAEDYEEQQEAEKSCNGQVIGLVNSWLAKFPGAEIK